LSTYMYVPYNQTPAGDLDKIFVHEKD